MHVFNLLEKALVAVGAVVDIHEADYFYVLAEAELEVIDIAEKAVGIDPNGPYNQVRKAVQRAFIRSASFDKVIFAGTQSTRGAKAGVSPFIQFLRDAGFTTPFTYRVGTTRRAAYRTANWQFVIIYDNHLGVGNIGKVNLLELDVKRKTAGATLRNIKKLLAKHAENVPNERGVTGAQKRTGSNTGFVAKSTETTNVIPDSAAEPQEPVDTDKVKGQRFNSFEDLGRCLL